MVKSTSSAQGLIFSKILNFELGKFSRTIFDEVPEDTFIVVSNQDDFFDTINFLECLQIVPDNGMTSNIEKRLNALAYKISLYLGSPLYLWNIERERPETCSSAGAADQYNGLGWD